MSRSPLLRQNRTYDRFPPSGLSALVSASTLALILAACGNGDQTHDDGAEHGLEWFAAAEDISAVHDALNAHKGEHPELQSILGDNPGIFAEDTWWTSLDHKGGSAPGVLASSWRAEGANGTWRTVVIQISGDPEVVAAEGMESLHLAQNALELGAPD